jgi:HNH endonuclease
VITLVKDLVSGPNDFSPTLLDEFAGERSLVQSAGLLFRITVSPRLNAKNTEFHSRCFTVNPKGVDETHLFLTLAQELGKELQRKNTNWTEEYFRKPLHSDTIHNPSFWSAVRDMFKSEALRESERLLRDMREYKRKSENYIHAARQDTNEFMKLVHSRIAAQTAVENTASFKSLVESEISGNPLPMYPTRRNQRNYVLYRGGLWSSAKDYSIHEWKLLVDKRVSQGEAQIRRLSAELSQETVQGYDREIIPEEVRIAVWRRDGGHCTRCGSREKLEYDHIIPVAKGGSNTARNIELLCESCNRSKGDEIR